MWRRRRRRVYSITYTRALLIILSIATTHTAHIWSTVFPSLARSRRVFAKNDNRRRPNLTKKRRKSCRWWRQEQQQQQHELVCEDEIFLRSSHIAHYSSFYCHSYWRYQLYRMSLKHLLLLHFHPHPSHPCRSWACRTCKKPSMNCKRNETKRLNTRLRTENL